MHSFKGRVYCERKCYKYGKYCIYGIVENGMPCVKPFSITDYTGKIHIDTYALMFRGVWKR